MAKKKKGQRTVLEAVDTLSHLADLDVVQPEKVEWLDPAKVKENQETIRDTFRTINTYLQHLYQKDQGELTRPQTQKGIQAMIQLAVEAVDKVNEYTELFRGAHAKDETISEFKKLQKFYLSKVFSKIKSEKESWELEKEGDASHEEKQVLKDLETVRQDRDYELFYLTHEDGTPFFSSNLLRHLRMVGNFDETFISEQREDLLSKLEAALDRDLHLSAQKLIQECSDLIDLFYKEALQHKDHETLMCVSKAIMALLLASNPKNLRHNSIGKCALDYWGDFVAYLRLGLQTESYEKWRESRSHQELPIYKTCLRLMHRMSHALFLRMGARHDDLELIHHLAGEKLEEGHTLWASLAEAEQKIMQELRNYPSGPLMKVLKMFRQEEDQEGFDPLLQHNAAGQIFTLATDDLHTTLIHTPMPIHQTTFERGEIVPEFKGYLHALGERKHLYINLQDRTSEKEHFRCKLLEELSEKGEFSQNLTLLSLPKDSDFYYQIKQYGTLEQAQEFCQLCVQQILGGAQYGYYFLPGKTPKEWLEPMVQFIHQQFFNGEEKLNRKQRLDFIEILYFFIVLRYLDQEKPDVLNFSCKDGLDTGAAAAAAFYGFTRLLSSEVPWTDADRDCFLYTLFLPALFVRHRSIDTSYLQRCLSALEHFEMVLKTQRDMVLKGCSKILPDIPLKHLKITDVA